jgi:hypothetical protein
MFSVQGRRSSVAGEKHLQDFAGPQQSRKPAALSETIGHGNIPISVNLRKP